MSDWAYIGINQDGYPIYVRDLPLDVWDPLTGKADHFWRYEPAPIYDELVTKRLYSLQGMADIAFEGHNLADYARIVTLLDRIRQKVVPPWTPLELS